MPAIRLEVNSSYVLRRKDILPIFLKNVGYVPVPSSHERLDTFETSDEEFVLFAVGSVNREQLGEGMLLGGSYGQLAGNCQTTCLDLVV